MLQTSHPITAQPKRTQLSRHVERGRIDLIGDARVRIWAKTNPIAGRVAVDWPEVAPSETRPNKANQPSVVQVV